MILDLIPSLRAGTVHKLLQYYLTVYRYIIIKLQKGAVDGAQSPDADHDDFAAPHREGETGVKVCAFFFLHRCNIQLGARTGVEKFLYTIGN